MKLVVGIALATKRAVSSEGDEVPEERGRIGRLSGGRRGKHQSGQRPGRHRARAKVALTFFSLAPSALGHYY